VSGFVVCRSCGTRIKAGRGHCLKCFEPLPDPDEPVRLPLSESLGLSRNQEIMVAVGTAVAVALLAAVIWQTWPTSENDEAQPVSMPVSSPAAPVQTPTPPAAAEPFERAAAEPPRAEASAAASPDPDLDAVRADYESKLANRPNDPDLHSKLGLTLERMGRLPDAEKQFERAVALAPLEPAYRISLARTAAALGQWDRSVDQYRETVRLRPKDYDALTALGQTLQKKNDDQAAVVEFQKARRINPSGPAASLGLATSLEKVGRIDEAVKEFRLYLDIEPPPPDADKVRAHLALLSRSKPQVK